MILTMISLLLQLQSCVLLYKLQDVIDVNLHLLHQIHLEGDVFINQFSGVVVVPIFGLFSSWVDILAGVVLHIGIIDYFRIVIKLVKSRQQVL